MTSLITAPYGSVRLGCRLRAVHAASSPRRHPPPQGGRSTPLTLCQSVGQIVDQWGEHGKRAWYEGVSFRTYAAVQDLDTATELEGTFGTYGVMASSEGTNTGSTGKAMETSSRSRGANISYHEIARPLIRKAELMHDTRADEQFVLARSTPPIRCGRAIYFRRAELTARVASNRFYKGMTANVGD